MENPSTSEFSKSKPLFQLLRSFLVIILPIRSNNRSFLNKKLPTIKHFTYDILHVPFPLNPLPYIARQRYLEILAVVFNPIITSFCAPKFFHALNSFWNNTITATTKVLVSP